jgi:hypothetical protein
MPAQHQVRTMTNRRMFLSHSSKDKDQVRRLALDLQEAGVAVWLDEWEILVGDSITQKLQVGLDECSYLAIWLTEHSVKSKWVEKEWQSKFHQEITSGAVTVLPLLSETCEIPVFLRDKKYADFRENYRGGLHELLAVFHRPSSRIKDAPTDKPTLLQLEYFNVDSTYGRFYKDYVEEYNKGVVWHPPRQSNLLDMIFKPGTPVFKTGQEQPVFLMTVHNGDNRKIVLHTIELDVIHIEPYMSAGDTEVLKSLAIYDVEVPLKTGVFPTPMIPQIGIAAGDVASFNIRLVPPKKVGGMRIEKDYSLNIKVQASSGKVVESGVFHITLLT